MSGVDGLLNSEADTLYRALSARANYLSQDRLDIRYSTKELCGDLGQPNDLSHGQLKNNWALFGLATGDWCLSTFMMIYSL